MGQQRTREYIVFQISLVVPRGNELISQDALASSLSLCLLLYSFALQIDIHHPENKRFRLVKF